MDQGQVMANKQEPDGEGVVLSLYRTAGGGAGPHANRLKGRRQFVSILFKNSSLAFPYPVRLHPVAAVGFGLIQGLIDPYH